MLIEKKKISAKGELSIEFEEVISDDFDTAKTFNKFFVNIVTYLPRDITQKYYLEINADKINNLVLKAVNEQLLSHGAEYNMGNVFLSF